MQRHEARACVCARLVSARARKHCQAADVARADRTQLSVGPRQATRCAVHHLACPGLREFLWELAWSQRPSFFGSVQRLAVRLVAAGSAMNCAAPVEHV